MNSYCPATYAKLMSKVEPMDKVMYDLKCWRDIESPSDKVKLQIAAVEKYLLEEGTSDEDGKPDQEDSQDFDNWPFDKKVAYKYIQLERSARKRGKEFDLSLVDVRNLLRRKMCYYTNVAFETTGPNQRTIDRLDSSKGYVKGNVVACTFLVNQAKNQLLEREDALFKDNLKVLIAFVDTLKRGTKV